MGNAELAALKQAAFLILKKLVIEGLFNGEVSRGSKKISIQACCF